MSYSPRDREKWSKVLTIDMISSEESDGEEDTIIVHPLQWRSEKVSCFLHSLDSKANDEKSPQAKRQTKRRVESSEHSLRSLPVESLPAWAIVA